MKMERVIIDATQKSCTDCHDVIKLLDVKGGDNPKFELYKTVQVDEKRNACRWIYFVLIEGDKFPIIVTEKAAHSISDNPQIGITLVNNYRHR